MCSNCGSNHVLMMDGIHGATHFCMGCKHSVRIPHAALILSKEDIERMIRELENEKEGGK